MPSALDELLQPLLARAYGFALHLLRDPTDAEDLLQEAALAACRGFGTFQQGTNFKAWFFTILTNCFYGRHRRVAHVPDPARHVLSRLDGEEIASALQSLPEEYRVVSTLYFIDDLPTRKSPRYSGFRWEPSALACTAVASSCNNACGASRWSTAS